MNIKTRMYAVSMRHLSSMQKGIQSNHAIIEYSNAYGSNMEYKRWSRIHKVDIFLEINTSDELTYLIDTLKGLQHRHREFREPDLYNIVTAVAFIVDERVWDIEKYPTPITERIKTLRELLTPLRLAT